MGFDLQRLRFERLSRRISQQTIANALGMTRSSYHKREVGAVKMSVEEFAIVLQVLGIPQENAGIFFTREVPERELI